MSQFWLWSKRKLGAGPEVYSVVAGGSGQLPLVLGDLRLDISQRRRARAAMVQTGKICWYLKLKRKTSMKNEPDVYH